MRLRLLAGLGVAPRRAVRDRDGVRAGPASRARTADRHAPPLFPPAPGELVVWRRSKAVGKPWRGRLVRGVKLPSYGADWFTYDWGTRSSPNRIWRRYGHDRLVRMLLRVVGEYRLAHPEAPRVGIADLSRPRGGSFGRRFGGLGHASHQNGLDVDVLYPRARRPGDPARASAPDRPRAGPGPGEPLRGRGRAEGVRRPEDQLRGKRGVVTKLRNHDDHMHVRIKPRRGGR